MKIISTLQPAPCQRKSRKRVGRGIGSTLGKTCGRGHKGYGSRSGSKRKIGFEGGQMPIQRRLPKFGFSSRISTVTENVRLSDLISKQKTIDDQPLTIALLKQLKLIKRTRCRVKLFRDADAKQALMPFTVAQGQPIVLSASLRSSK